MVAPGMAVVNGAEDLDNMNELNMFVVYMEEFNKESLTKGNKGYGFVERAALTLHSWNLKLASGDQTDTRVFWDKKNANTKNPIQ